MNSNSMNQNQMQNSSSQGSLQSTSLDSQIQNASKKLNGVQAKAGESAAMAAAQQFMQTGNADLSSQSLQNTVQQGRQSGSSSQGSMQ